MTRTNKENPWINLIVNVAIPMYIMTKMASKDSLGPVNAVLIATAFPLGYGIFDYVKNKHLNKISESIKANKSYSVEVKEKMYLNT